MELFNTSPSQPILIVLTIIYFIFESISTFDTRIIQGKKNGTLPPDEPEPPEWTGFFGILSWLIWPIIFFLNWKYALLIFAIKYVLKVPPVLETVGNFILRPLRK